MGFKIAVGLLLARLPSVSLTDLLIEHVLFVFDVLSHNKIYVSGFVM